MSEENTAVQVKYNNMELLSSSEYKYLKTELTSDQLFSVHSVISLQLPAAIAQPEVVKLLSKEEEEEEEPLQLKVNTADQF